MRQLRERPLRQCPLVVSFRSLYVAGQPYGFHGPDEIPPDIRLPPVQTQTGGAGIRMMVLMPVFTPRCELQRTQPPDIHAGVALFGVSQMCEAIDDALHVQAIHQTNGADPEEAPPA